MDTNKSAGDELQSLAQETVELMKGVCGRDVFSQAYSLVHKEVATTREKRRKQAALEVQEECRWLFVRLGCHYTSDLFRMFEHVCAHKPLPVMLHAHTF